MNKFWKEQDIDMFKDGVSVPGLTMKYLFSNVPNVHFSLFNEKDKDLYYTMKDNNVGGPSIIFNRYHETDKTFIRNAEMTRKKSRAQTMQESGRLRRQCAIPLGDLARYVNRTVYATTGRRRL